MIDLVSDAYWYPLEAVCTTCTWVNSFDSEQRMEAALREHINTAHDLPRKVLV